VKLLKRIQRTRSPLTRVKLLTQAWKHVRALNPKERARLASAVGMKGAEALLNRLGSGRDGEIRPSKLMEMVKKAEEQESMLLGKGIDVLESMLDEEDPPQKAAAPEPPPEPEIEAGPEPPPKPPVVLPAPVTVAPPPEPEPEPEPEPLVEVEKEEPPPPPAPQRRERKRKPERRKERPTELQEKLPRTESLSARFRVLRKRIGEAKAMDAAALRGLLELFPDGWARRRALQALLREGIPADVKTGIALISTLENDLDQRWCMLTLLEEMADDPAAVQTLSVATPFPAVRRRARRILGKAW
jgi:hypothetical protein